MLHPRGDRVGAPRTSEPAGTGPWLTTTRTENASHPGGAPTGTIIISVGTADRGTEALRCPPVQPTVTTKELTAGASPVTDTHRLGLPTACRPGLHPPEQAPLVNNGRHCSLVITDRSVPARARSYRPRGRTREGVSLYKRDEGSERLRRWPRAPGLPLLTSQYQLRCLILHRHRARPHLALRILG